jgi:SAM-dependent methyltransferase
MFGHDGPVLELTHDQKPSGWSAGAEGYESAFAPFSAMYATDAIKLVGLQPADRFLDVCAGTGAMALPAARLGAEVTAVDFAPGMVALLRERMLSSGLEARVEEMDGQALDLPDGYFDASASMFGLIFFPDVAAGMRELARVTRPGGRVLVGAWDRDPARYPLLELMFRAMARLGLKRDGPPEVPVALRLGEKGVLAAAFRSAGLVDVQVHDVVHTWVIDDAAKFFNSLPEWAPPMQPLFASLPPAAMGLVREGFVDAVRDLSRNTGGLETTALLALGRRASL